MGKRVAVFSNGWSDDYLQEMTRGMGDFAREADVDLFLFVNFSAYRYTSEENRREFNILTLPYLEDFDGVILLTSTFNLKEEVEYLHRKVLQSGLPAISVDYELDGMESIETDNYSSMYEMVRHLIENHDAKSLLYIGGIPEHKENLIRQKAFLKAAEDRGILVSPGNLLGGDWTELGAQKSLESWVETSGSLPDAIVCANDVMAIGVCSWLEKKGYRVPEDVTVTGFDHIRRGQTFRPVLTSVDREWEKLGYRSLQLLLQKMQGIALDGKMIHLSRPVFRQSCGCTMDGAAILQMIEKQKQESVSYAENLDADSHFRHLYKKLRKVENSDQISKALSEYLQKDHSLEGDEAAVCLHPDFFFVDNKDSRMLEEGYPEEMDVICSLSKGIPGKHRMENCREVMFRTANEAEEPSIYLFVPLHSDDKNYGFARLSRNESIFSDKVLYIWTRHMNQTLEQVRSYAKLVNITNKLSEMSLKDGLTGTYNRFGCEKVIYPSIRERQENGGRSIVMLVDIDQMKSINDSFGHTSGDQAILLLTEALRSGLSEEFYIARYGGDEFFVAGELKENMDQDDLTSQVMKRLDELAQENKVPYTLKASVGAVVLEKGEQFDLIATVQQADKIMYLFKKEHHRLYF